MPQMMPINWMISFIFFIIMFLMFNIMNYYIFNIQLKNNFNKMTNFTMKNFNWKW
uniref:ATP synthase complex subunit 8 n=1 Tax=Lista haraldusalis TaxID=1429835 RepID=A0A067YFN1_9NEOP|nr:ATP synthase F0 subunit 8 [Lista haraldusalis]AHB23429.1 ATP synthase F0 subunit 8 [Lista haraldusalis]UNP24728.1 ATP synthase F0 subunit 8 [Lista haraldusalis]